MNLSRGILAILLLAISTEAASPQPKPPAAKQQAKKPAAPPADAGLATPPPADAGVAEEFAAEPDPEQDERAFEAQVKSLEERTLEVKERVFRTKARLLLLQEAIMGVGASKSAAVSIIHRNEMGNLFDIESIAYTLDGNTVFARTASDGNLRGASEIPVFSGRITPGEHQVALQIHYRGNGSGVFRYLDGYKFNITSNQPFTAEPGKLTTLKVVAYEKGSITQELQDRPAIRYDVKTARDMDSTIMQTQASK